jgi:glucose/arabinose dehydrogenase
MQSRGFLPLSVIVVLVPFLAAVEGCSDDEADDATGAAGSGNTGAQGSGGAGADGGSGVGGNGNNGGGGPSTEADCSAPSGAPAALKLTEVVTGLSSPLHITYARGDNERLYVLEQDGVIQLLKNGQVTPFLDISDKVLGGGEQGLLGLAFHPNYLENGRFFIHYSSDANGNGIIAEYKRSADNPDVADPNPVIEPLLEIEDPYSNHNGGTIEFSPVDGFLYIGMGDGGDGGDPQENGQNPMAVLGKLLRIDIDVSGMDYGSPPGNLEGGAPEVFDWGLRNPYRWSFDICTGDRYIGDVGQNAWEEIDVAPASQGPTNWGWDNCEGNHTFEGEQCPGDSQPPVAEYPHSGNPFAGPPGCGYSVLGGYVYRGTAIPWLRGTYFYAEYCGAQTWTLKWAGGQLVEGPTDITQDLYPGWPNNYDQLTSFGQDNRGEMYVVSGSGTIYRIDPE